MSYLKEWLFDIVALNYLCLVLMPCPQLVSQELHELQSVQMLWNAQACSLHGEITTDGPLQASVEPPLHWRLRDRIPPPQLVLHTAHSDQVVQKAWQDLIWHIFSCTSVPCVTHCRVLRCDPLPHVTLHGDQFTHAVQTIPKWNDARYIIYKIISYI